MKILNIMPFDEVGSIQMRCLNIALALKQQNIETIFIVPSEGSRFSTTLLKNGFKTYKLKILRPKMNSTFQSICHNFYWIIGIPRAMLVYLRAVQYERPDVIQINGMVSFQEALSSSLFFRKKTIWALIGNIYPKALIISLLPLTRLCKTRVFISKKLAYYYFGKISDEIVYEPVDSDFFNKNSISILQLTELKCKLGLSFPIIGFLGFISPVKGIEYTLYAMVYVIKKFKNAKLIIAGDIDYSDGYYFKLTGIIKQLNLERNVIFLGYIKREDAPAILSLFDVFVSTSLNEGTPVSIVEAMSMELPVVAVDVGGISEQIINGKTGILLTSRDPLTIANAVCMLLSQNDKRKLMGTEARTLAEKKFSYSLCIPHYKKIYHTFQ